MLFFLSTDYGLVVLCIRHVVSMKNDEPDMGHPIILSLYLRPLSALMPCFITTNSAPKTDVSTIGQCSHILRNCFSICKICHPLHHHCPQTFRYLLLSHWILGPFRNSFFGTPIKLCPFTYFNHVVV